MFLDFIRTISRSPTLKADEVDLHTLDTLCSGFLCPIRLLLSKISTNRTTSGTFSFSLRLFYVGGPSIWPPTVRVMC